MRNVRRAVLSLIGIGLLVVGVFSIRAVSDHGHKSAVMARQKPSEVVQKSTPADLQIRLAQAKTRQSPDKPAGFNLLAAAYMQKSRETGDFGFNARAEAALTRSLEIEPDNYDGIKLKAKLLLTSHRFSDALDMARKAQAINPQDHDVYGALTDAFVELGDYKSAAEAAQQMVNLRPDTSSYARVSYLRSLHGDREGAIEAMTLAVKAADPRDPEGMAWCLIHLGDELMNDGKREQAEALYDHALFVFPDYHLALSAKARARLASSDTEAAIELYKRSEERVPLPETVIALGDLYTKLGRLDEAHKQYALVEFIERTNASVNTYSHQLALFYAERETKLDDALAIARSEREKRADIYTSDALAWVLYKRGELAEAKKAIDEAMRLGTRDARLLYHAGMIYKALADPRSAARYLKLALSINPSFDVLQADVAKQTLHALNA